MTNIENLTDLREFIEEVGLRGHAPDLSRNDIRVARAGRALLAHQGRHEDEFDAMISDLLADLYHLADAVGVDWELMVDRAYRHHAAEAAEGGVVP